VRDPNRRHDLIEAPQWPEWRRLAVTSGQRAGPRPEPTAAPAPRAPILRPARAAVTSGQRRGRSRPKPTAASLLKARADPETGQSCRHFGPASRAVAARTDGTTSRSAAKNPCRPQLPSLRATPATLTEPTTVNEVFPGQNVGGLPSIRARGGGPNRRHDRQIGRKEPIPTPAAVTSGHAGRGRADGTTRGHGAPTSRPARLAVTSGQRRGRTRPEPTARPADTAHRPRDRPELPSVLARGRPVRQREPRTLTRPGLCRRWQVLDSNQRRLSRRIYSPLPLATRATCRSTNRPRSGPRRTIAAGPRATRLRLG
jgi:hypothetical protein